MLGSMESLSFHKVFIDLSLLICDFCIEMLLNYRGMWKNDTNMRDARLRRRHRKLEKVPAYTNLELLDFLQIYQ